MRRGRQTIGVLVMTNKEKLFVSKLLEMASKEFTRHGCNDLPKEMRDYFTDKEWAEINLKAAQNNEHTDTPKDITELKWYDWYCMTYFAHLLEEESIWDGQD
jgi:hypothetical protein